MICIMEKEAEVILTVADIQAAFKCGHNQAYEIIHSPGFPSITIGRRLYIPKRAFDAWLARNIGKVVLK